MQVQAIPRMSRAHDALGAAIREVRARRGLSQEELGFRAQLHRNYLGSLERGEVNPTFRTLMRLTTGLRVTLSDLIVIYERNMTEPNPRVSSAT